MSQNNAKSEKTRQFPDLGTLHHGRLCSMIDACLEAGHHTLKYFRRSDLRIEAKSDDSPVTIADREAEQLVRDQLGKEYPDDTLQGEEFSEKTGTSTYRWIVDPIDGTKSFVCGVPLYSCLIALEKEGEPIAGVIYIPATGEMVFAAQGEGCWYRAGDDQEWKTSRVSDKKRLTDAVFLTSQADLFRTQGAEVAFQELEKQSWVSRSWGDGYGYLLVATGRADVMVDAVCNPWDVAAMVPILGEAGGCFTDWKGNITPRGGNGIGTNGNLHQQVVEILSQPMR
ncbi:histidinol-phosphatase [Rubripirellula sp.]|nr:histidinol-phosphatase [Rubripirellula sp.]MDB4338548.1 histidinol-phosphatase [Rubripirellula sp.]